MSARFTADDDTLRPMGRATSGVIGMRFRDGDHLLAMDTVRPDAYVVTVTDGGYAKRTPVDEWSAKGRGILGVRAMKLVEERGSLVGALVADEEDELYAIASDGVVIRTRVADIRATGRDTMGVSLMDVSGDNAIVAVARGEASDDDEDDDDDSRSTATATAIADGDATRGATGSQRRAATASPLPMTRTTSRRWTVRRCRDDETEELRSRLGGHRDGTTLAPAGARRRRRGRPGARTSDGSTKRRRAGACRRATARRERPAARRRPRRSSGQPPGCRPRSTPARPALGSGAGAAAAAAAPPAAPRPAGPRRARLLVTRLDPWSVMKTAFMLSVSHRRS